MISATLPKSTDVLIVGAGPTGLALAISLAQAGIDHVVIDRLDEGQNTSRAAVIHAHTLEALNELGVADRLAEAGLKLERFSIRDRDRTLLQLQFNALPSDFSYLLMIPQDATEKIFAQRLSELGCVIWRGVTAERVEQDQSGVRVAVNAGGAETEIHARYVVGADGMHSIVRTSAGIQFEGERLEHSFVLADVRMDWGHGRDQVMLFFSPPGPLVIAPLPGGRFRIVAAVEQAPEHPVAQDIQTVLDTSGPTVGAARITEVMWTSRFRIHHRLATSYRRNRLFIMGDAAHVHSPAGGQGMNTGLVDATVLGRLLAAVVAGKRKESVLGLYEKLRRPAAEKVLHLAGGLTAMAMKKTSFERAVRNTRLSVMGNLAPIKQRLIMNLSGLSRRAAAHPPI